MLAERQQLVRFIVKISVCILFVHIRLQRENIVYNKLEREFECECVRVCVVVPDVVKDPTDLDLCKTRNIKRKDKIADFVC